MRNLVFCTLILFTLWSCSKDDDDKNSTSTDYKVSATIGSASFNVAQNSGAISAANSGGTTQINALSSDKGFKIFIPESSVTGTHSLDTSSIGITYSDDWLVFGNYILQTGTINIISFEPWPAALNASFEGWAFKNTNPDDSVYISNGLINIKL